jgi:hypothetical protein
MLVLTTFFALIFHSFLVDFGVNVELFLLVVLFALNPLQFDDAVTFDVLHVRHVLSSKARVDAQFACTVQVLAVSFVCCTVRGERSHRAGNRKERKVSNKSINRNHF